MSQTKKLPYSYHTFVYPFSYEAIDSIRMREEACDWILEAFYMDEINMPGKSEEELEEFRLQYNAFQYFFPKARQNMFNLQGSDDISELYKYKLDYTRESEYIIGKKEQSYHLRINNIRLALFKELKVGILSFETEYHPKTSDNHFEEALSINEFGRRLYPPYLTKDNLPTAEQIQLQLFPGARGDNSSESFHINFNIKNSMFDNKPGLVEELLPRAKGKSIISDIKPILDDRMYVISLIRDDVLSNGSQLNRFGIGTKNVNLDCEEGMKLAQDIYKFIFVDSKDCTCQNRSMLKEKLEEHLYARWVNYGTLHGITEYSMVCITGTNEGCIPAVITPFLMHYTEMVKLGIAQRSALVRLETEVGEVCKSLSIERKLTGDDRKKELDEINNVWKKYILFQNELLMPEVTFQEQGVELYQMLKASLKITELNDYIDSELNNLHDVANMEYAQIEQEANSKTNRSLNLLAVVGTILAAVGMAQDYLNTGKNESISITTLSVKYFSGFIALLILTIVVFNLFEKKGIKHNSIKGLVLLVFLITLFWLVTLLVPYAMYLL